MSLHVIDLFGDSDEIIVTFNEISKSNAKETKKDVIVPTPQLDIIPVDRSENRDKGRDYPCSPENISDHQI